ncbi:sugar transferase [Seonamhaeicola maritimus]|uniref:sugar transferase n=1 Tax=Seonamhaeicola maritimus TaxID=2591822 RepID=UPI001F4FA2C1|nr:sugar transferase [Seonamhaeicola maritimus]
MKKRDIILKRVFDICLSILGLIVLWWLIVLLAFIAFLDTRQKGIFNQIRVGKEGRLFNIYKIRTIKTNSKNSERISSLGKFLRKSKLDELPQLINVLIGDMSFVGPRPDLKGFANNLSGEDRIILTVRPGITGIASLYFRDEEATLNQKRNPEKYNRTVIWPKKVELNKAYIENYSFINDLRIILRTILEV